MAQRELLAVHPDREFAKGDRAYAKVWFNFEAVGGTQLDGDVLERDAVGDSERRSGKEKSIREGNV